MAFGLGVLQLAPDAFWQMTPRELAAAVRGVYGDVATIAPPDARALDELMAQFPDDGSGLE